MASQLTAIPPMSNFPEDIEREIFEITARTHSGCAPRLVLVAKRIHLWITPLIYEIIIVRNILGIRAPETQEWERYGIHTRHLLLGEGAEVRRYLSTCPNITNLAIWSGHTCPKLIPLLTQMPLLRLSANLVQIFGSATAFSNSCREGHPAFVNLTHLHIVRLSGPWASWTGLIHLPRLTHLSASVNMADDAFVDGVLENCKQIRVLVLLSGVVGGGSGSPDIRLRRRGDRQITLCEVPNYISDWKAGARGEHDYWDYAEDALALAGVRENAVDLVHR